MTTSETQRSISARVSSSVLIVSSVRVLRLVVFTGFAAGLHDPALGVRPPGDEPCPANRLALKIQGQMVDDLD